MPLPPSDIILIESGLTGRTVSIDRYTGDVQAMLLAAGHSARRHGSGFYPGLHPVRWRMNQRLYREINESAPDFVHTMTTGLAYQLPRIDGPARIATCHDLYQMTIPNFAGPGFRPWFDLRMLRKAAGGFRAADALIAISSWTAGHLADWAEIDPARITVVPNMVSDTFRPVADAEAQLAAAGIALPPRPRMLTVGTAVWTKNLSLAIRAMVAPGMAGVQYVRVGPPLPPDLVDLARNLGVWERITHLGSVPEAQLPAVYSACDVLVQPSYVEGFGYPAAEAMACGTPVVCSDGGALPEVVGDAAIIVPLHEPPHLADEGRAFGEAIARVVADPGLAAGMRARGLDEACRFRAEAVTPQLLAVYEAAAEARARR